MKTVPERLADLGALYRERNALYGDNYKQFGHVMARLFPGGVQLKTADDFNRFALFMHVQHKISRYAQQFAGGGHPDSLDDAAVYAQMLQEIDASRTNEVAAEKSEEFWNEVNFSWPSKIVPTELRGG